MQGTWTCGLGDNEWIRSNDGDDSDTAGSSCFDSKSKFMNGILIALRLSNSPSRYLGGSDLPKVGCWFSRVANPISREHITMLGCTLTCFESRSLQEYKRRNNCCDIC